MNKIKREEIKREEIKIETIISKKKIITKETKAKLENLGYKEICLGTGKQSYSSSKQIKTWVLNNTFAQGNFFGIGISNMAYGKGHLYYAYAKEVV